MESENRICCFQKLGKKKCQKICHNDTNYCRIHQQLDLVSPNPRISCQFCHQLILETLASKHAKICSMKPRELPSYYLKGVNDPSSRLTDRLSPTNEKMFEMSAEDLDHLVFKINQLYEEYVLPMLGPRKIGDQSQSILPSLKHRTQELMMFKLMKLQNIIPNDLSSTEKKELIFLDLGSGKGSLTKTLSLHEIPNQSKFICIERSHYKHHCEKQSTTNHSSYRAQIDLLDVNFPELIHHYHLLDQQQQQLPSSLANCPSQSEQIEVIGMGKHLCGNATDIAIIGMNSLLPSPSLPSPSPPSSPPPSPETQTTITLRGVCIALCCHSNCQWSSSLCTNWFHSLPSDQEILQEEWDFIRKWSGLFSLNKHEIESDQKEEKSEEFGESTMRRMSYLERVELGRKCKRLIDYGRVYYLRQVMKMNATLVYYTEEAVTPENVVLLAWNDSCDDIV